MKATVLIPVVIVIFIGLTAWLWTLQPKASKVAGTQSSTTAAPARQEEENFSPKDATVQTSKIIKLKGKMLPSSIIFILANDFQTSAQADENGSFEKELTLASGLNLIDVVSISTDLSRESKKTFSYFLDTKSANGANFFAGIVKTIFDNLLTITTPNGPRSLKMNSSTVIELPKDPTEQESTTAANDIRVGDFAIGVGDLGAQDTLSVKKLTIIRTDKPQNKEEYAIVKILTAPKSNLFTAKTNKDSKILELTVTKDTQGILDGKEAKVTDITKDKNAVVIYHTDGDKKVVDLIYLLP